MSYHSPCPCTPHFPNPQEPIAKWTYNQLLTVARAMHQLSTELMDILGDGPMCQEELQATLLANPECSEPICGEYDGPPATQAWSLKKNKG